MSVIDALADLAPRDHSAGAASRAAANGRFPGAGHQDDVARFGDWFRRIDTRWPDHQQLDFSAVPRVRAGWGLLFRTVLSALALEPIDGEKAQCRQSLSSGTSIRASARIRCSRACHSKWPRAK